MSNLNPFRSLLEGLRAGDVSFEVVVKKVRPALEFRASYFIKRWGWSGQAAIDAEDLIQEMTIALWRAVDSWDPARAGVVPYVDMQLGRTCTRRLREVTGYPDPRRSAPATRAYIEPSGPLVEAAAREVGGRVYLIDEIAGAAERARELLGELAGVDRDVTALVLAGRTLDETTREIYADPEKRLAYRMDSIKDARRLVDAAARRATRAASSLDAAAA